MGKAASQMQTVARNIEKVLPKGYGFFVLCFPFSDNPDALADYASNATREDIVKVMKGFIQRNPFPKPELN